jgi:hypothetical protein
MTKRGNSEAGQASHREQIIRGDAGTWCRNPASYKLIDGHGYLEGIAVSSAMSIGQAK